jgi:magnesium transporter
LVRLSEQIDASRDLLSAAMEARLSVVANRTNEVTKQLTVFASIFMPLSFVVGFFGQNFAQVQTGPMFWLMVALVPAIPVALLVRFRARKWF